MIICLYLGIGFTKISYASKPMKIINTGYGSIIDNGVFGAKRQAIDDALRGVISQAMEPMMNFEKSSENLQLLEENIYSNRIRYIHLYEIISSGINVDSLYVITLSALVDWKEIEKDLDVLGLLHNRLGMPSLMLLVNESSSDFDKYGGLSSVEQTLLEKFKKKGFEFVDIDSEIYSSFSDDLELARIEDSVAINLGNELGADVVIIGESDLSIVNDTDRSPGAIISIQATVRLQALKAVNGAIIAEVSGIAVYPHRNPALGAARAIAKVSSKVSEELATVIQYRWKTEVNAGRQIFLKVQDIRDFSSFTNFKRSLDNFVHGLVNITGRSYDGISGEFELIVRSTPEKLASELSGKSFEEFDIKVEGLTINTLTISFTESN